MQVDDKLTLQDRIFLAHCSLPAYSVDQDMSMIVLSPTEVVCIKHGEKA